MLIRCPVPITKFLFPSEAYSRQCHEANMNEDDRYRTSSQYRYWSYTPAGLADLRSKTNKLATERVRAAIARVQASRAASASQNASAETSEAERSGTPAVTAPSEVNFLTPDEELKLVRFFCQQALQLGDHLNLPTDVKATAIQYLKRFYLTNSTMTYPPAAILKTCLFLATKTENHYYRLTKFADAIGKTTPEDVLASEFLLTQALRFTFDVRHPFRALEGAAMELQALASGSAPVLPGVDNAEIPPELGDVAARVRDAHGNARERLKTSALLTDAYFHFTPSQIMLGSLLLADAELTRWFMTVKLPSAPLLERVMETLRACADMLASVPPDSQPGEAEMRELKGLAKKLNRCRDPEKADLVGLRRAKRDGDGEEELRKAKKRKLEREKVQKEGEDLFGPALVKRDV
ncbi:hypothetical protein V500_00364 [Pseudogymnoascus sp. VKM F-4518 (FW-2643)]|nr:hypothetical protein V500_00364 [Pseudogymnoascus sp. VKM F-4518 (FW-2643)]